MVSCTGCARLVADPATEQAHAELQLVAIGGLLLPEGEAGNALVYVCRACGWNWTLSDARWQRGSETHWDSVASRLQLRNGAGFRNRTEDLPLTRRLLYQLS